MPLNPSGIVFKAIGSDNGFKLDTKRCIWIKSRLSKCSACIDVCPEKALEKTKNGFILKDNCMSCGLCVAACPTGAIYLDSSKFLNAGFSTQVGERYFACSERINEAAMVARQDMEISCLGALFPYWLAALGYLGNEKVTIWIGKCEECRLGQKRAWSSFDEDTYLGNLHITKQKMPSDQEFEKKAEVSRRGFFNMFSQSITKAVSKKISSYLPEVKNNDTSRLISIKSSLKSYINASKDHIGLLNGDLPDWMKRSLFANINIDEALCSACFVCTKLCPTKALNLQKTNETRKNIAYRPEMCVNCKLCVDVCMNKAVISSHSGISLESKILVSMQKQPCSVCKRDWFFTGNDNVCPICKRFSNKTATG